MNQLCVLRARDGDPQAREELITALMPRMVRLARHYARCCREDADDLLQEAWAGMLEALPAVDVRIGNPEQYLLQYARWRLLDAIKRARARDLPALDEMTGDDPACLQAFDAVLPALAVAEFITRLTATQRAVLACLLAGMTWREAGRLLGCTSANIAYHVRQLRAHYARWSEENRTPAR